MNKPPIASLARSFKHSVVEMHAAPLTVLLVIVGTTLAIYYGGLDGPFLLDDRANIKLAQIDHLSAQSLIDMLRSAGGRPMDRPLSFLSFTANYWLFGESEFYFKAVNLAIHTTIGLLLYPLGIQLLELIAPDKHRRYHKAIASAAAGLWLIEPMHVSTVLYAVQRMAQLSALFVTLALLAYLHLRRALSEKYWRRASAAFAAFVLAAALGLASKEDAALVPVYILVIELCAYCAGRSALELRRTTLAVFALCIAPLLLGAGAAAFMFDTFEAGYLRRTFDLQERLATQARILWQYLRQLVLPRLSEFGLYNDGIAVSDFRDFRTHLAILSWIAAILGAFLVRKRAPMLLFGVCWFLAAHALESTFIPLELYFEHRNYLATFGVTLALSGTIASFSSRRYRAIGATALVALGLLFTLQTIARVQVWDSYVGLARVAVVEQPQSPRALATYGDVLISAGRFDRGIDLLQRGAEAKPNDAGFEVAMLRYACRADSFSQRYYANAVEAVRTERITAFAINSITNVVKMSQKEDACEALSPQRVLAFLNAALTGADSRSRDRTHASLHALRGKILHSEFKQYDAAIDAFARANRRYPGWPDAWRNRIVILVGLGRLDEARSVLSDLEHRSSLWGPVGERRLAKLRSLIEEAEPGRTRSSVPPSARE